MGPEKTKICVVSIDGVPCDSRTSTGLRSLRAFLTATGLCLVFDLFWEVLSSCCFCPLSQLQQLALQSRVLSIHCLWDGCLRCFFPLASFLRQDFTQPWLAWNALCRPQAGFKFRDASPSSSSPSPLPLPPPCWH